MRHVRRMRPLWWRLRPAPRPKKGALRPDLADVHRRGRTAGRAGRRGVGFPGGPGGGGSGDPTSWLVGCTSGGPHPKSRAVSSSGRRRPGPASARCHKSWSTSLTIHDLRHTYASLARKSGADLRYVQKTMGHSTPTVTANIYSDLYSDELDQVATNLDQLHATEIHTPTTGQKPDESNQPPSA